MHHVAPTPHVKFIHGACRGRIGCGEAAKQNRPSSVTTVTVHDIVPLPTGVHTSQQRQTFGSQLCTGAISTGPNRGCVLVEQKNVS